MMAYAEPDKAREQRIYARSRKRMIRGVCAYGPCGRTFIGQTGKRYCSKRCGIYHWREQRSDREPKAPRESKKGA